MARLLLAGRIMRNIVLCSMLVVLASPSVLAAQAADASQGHRHDQPISSNAPPEEDRWDRRKLTVSAGLGFFSPTGFAGGHLTFSISRWRIMVGGGVSAFYDTAGRGALGIGYRIVEGRRDALVAEVWASITGKRNPELYGLGHLMLGWELLTAKGFTMRAMGGLATRFGPLDACMDGDDFCIDSPVVPSVALSFGYSFETSDVNR